MTISQIADSKLAAIYTARLLLSSNSETTRRLRDLVGWGASGCAKRLYGLSNDDVKAALIHLTEPPLIEDAEPTVDEHVIIARLRRDLWAAKSRADEMALGLGDARDFRKNILGLVDAPLEPRKIVALKSNRRAMTWVIVLSDNHLGKRITRDEVSGLQDYNVEIARNRVARTFAKSVELIRLNGSPVDRILVMCLARNSHKLPCFPILQRKPWRQPNHLSSNQ